MHFTIVGRISSVETIAAGKSVRIRRHLIRTFGAGRWRKMKGEATIRFADGTLQRAELHHCTSCHRPGLIGQEQAARLAGQDYDYLLRLLRGFKAKTASDLDGTMTIAAQPLGDEEIVSLVHYIASLAAEP